MFFKTKDFSFEIITILNLSWNKRNDMSGVRTQHALSYRIIGDTTFVHQNEIVKVGNEEIAFVPANYEYKQVSSSEKLIVIHFSSNDNLSNKIVNFKPENPKYYEKLFIDLYNIWTRKQLGYKYECKSILYKIIYKIEREYSQTKHINTNNKISDAVDYIYDNFTDNSISVSFLANMCNMSETYFRRLFQNTFKTTPLKFINRLRLDYAKELLHSGYYTVEETASKCGYSTVSYFSAFIKKETGKNPSDFKL